MYVIVYIHYLATTLGKQGSHFECTKTSGGCSVSWRNGKIIVSIDFYYD